MGPEIGLLLSDKQLRRAAACCVALNRTNAMKLYQN